MRETRMEFRMNSKERDSLIKVADQYGISVGEYIRRKLFQGNPDLSDKDIYVSPTEEKSNLLMISLLYKILFLTKELLAKCGSNEEELVNADKRSLEYARRERERYGFKIIKGDNE